MDKKNTYYFLIMSQKDLIKNQVLEEILRERSNFYFSKNKNLDFWLLISPKFINEEKFLNELLKTNYISKNKEEINNLGAIVSVNKEFINWIKLRLGDFDNLNLLEKKKNTTSDGIYGYLELNTLDRDNINPLSFNKNKLDKSIFLNQYKTIINN